jgi:CubicO group peptidase (beta-lactamase class C family)
MPDGGMITTVTDLARLVDALLGGKLLSPPLLAAMTSSQTPPSTDLEHYGYGLELVVEIGAESSTRGGADPAFRRWSPCGSVQPSVPLRRIA